MLNQRGRQHHRSLDRAICRRRFQHSGVQPQKSRSPTYTCLTDWSVPFSGPDGAGPPQRQGGVTPFGCRCMGRADHCFSLNPFPSFGRMELYLSPSLSCLVLQEQGGDTIQLFMLKYCSATSLVGVWKGMSKASHLPPQTTELHRNYLD